MSTYWYPESKVIDEVSFKKTANGAVRAYLHAQDGQDGETLRAILAALKEGGYDTVPFTLAGKPTIEVRGFRREAELITLLDKRQWTGGQPVIKLDKEDHVSWMDKLRKRSLQAAGGLYAFGDYSFFMYGLKDSSPLDMAAGVLYGLPTPVLLAYGRNDQSQLQIKDFAKMMAKEFRQEVKNLPPQCSLKEITADHKKGIVQNINDLLQRYPSEFMNLCYAAAGACIFLAAAKHLKGLSHSGVPEKTVEGWLQHLQKTQPAITKEAAASMAMKNVKLENILNAGVGGMTVASGLFGTFVKEKAGDPDEEKKGGLAGLWEWARRKPLTVAGAGFMVSTLLHAAATAVAVKGQDPKHKKAVPFRVAFVVSALLAELMVAISSKGHGEGVVSDTSVDDSAVAIAADLIVKQPIGLQNHLIEQMGRFLGRPDVLAIKDEVAIDRLRREVEAGRNNPWVKAEAQDVPQEEAPSIPSAAMPKKNATQWQAKVTPPVENAGPQVQPTA